jgi:hypothetical protein
MTYKNNRSLNILKFIINHIDNGTLEDVFNNETFDEQHNAYSIYPFFIISTEMLEDIKNNVEHYRKMIGPDEPPTNDIILFTNAHTQTSIP